MKKLSILFIALVSLIALNGCNKHEVNEVDKMGCTNKNSLNYDSKATIDDGSCIATGPLQLGLVVEYTATWCGPCGDWGAPGMQALVDMGDVVGIACHASGDPMYNATLYNSLASCRPDGGGIPAFWVGDEKMPNSPSTFPGKMTNLMARDPEGSIVCKATRVGDNVSIKAYTEFLKEVTGDYYVSVMLLESGIDGSSSSGDFEQNGTANPDTYTHQHVLRAALDDNCYGESIATGTTIAGTMIIKDFTMAIDPDWTNELAIAVVLWKKNGTMFEYVNAFEYGF